MAYLIAGALVSLATVSGLWACLPGADGLAKPALVKNGIDAWVAIAITCGFALGVGGLIAGAAEAFGLLK